MGDLIMGYAKIDKNKIQPSPALAALTGFLSGLNTKKKELQDREDAQNKQAVDWYKAVQEQGIKERETQVKERGATTAEQVASTDFDYKTSLISKATEDINTSRAVETRTKEKWLFDKIPLEAQSNPNHPFNIAQREIKKADLWNQALNDIKKQEELDKLKYGVDYVNTGSYRKEQEIQLEFKRKEIEAQNIAKYTPSIQTNKGLVSPAQLQQDVETTGQLLVEGARSRTQKEITGMEIVARKAISDAKITARHNLELLKIKTGTESSPLVKNYNTQQLAYENDLNIRLGKLDKSPMTADEVDAFESRYNTLIQLHDAIMGDDTIIDVVVAPTPFTKLKDAVSHQGGLLGVIPAIGRRITGNTGNVDYRVGDKISGTGKDIKLTPEEQSDFAILTTPKNIKIAQDKYKGNEKKNFDGMIQAGYSTNTALKVLDEINKGNK
jgi:hypothetical protein